MGIGIGPAGGDAGIDVTEVTAPPPQVQKAVEVPTAQRIDPNNSDVYSTGKGKALKYASLGNAAQMPGPLPDIPTIAAKDLIRGGLSAEIVGPSGKSEVSELKTKLESFPTRQALRDEVYDKATANNYPGVDHRPDAERGIDSSQALKATATDMKKLQQEWPKLSQNEREKRVAGMMNSRLKADGVPPVSVKFDRSGMAKGTFQPQSWSLETSIPKTTTLSDKDAADLCDTLSHEGYHAEQDFLMARYALDHGAKPGDLKATLNESVIDSAAKAPPLTSSQTTLAKDLWSEVNKAGGMETYGEQRDRSFKEYEALQQGDAKTALSALKSNPTKENIEKAKSVTKALETAKAKAEADYFQYRQFKYEADAHLVGGAAAKAFQQLK